MSEITRLQLSATLIATRQLRRSLWDKSPFPSLSEIACDRPGRVLARQRPLDRGAHAATKATSNARFLDYPNPSAHACMSNGLTAHPTAAISAPVLKSAAPKIPVICATAGKIWQHSRDLVPIDAATRNDTIIFAAARNAFLETHWFSRRQLGVRLGRVRRPTYSSPFRNEERPGAVPDHACNAAYDHLFQPKSRRALDASVGRHPVRGADLDGGRGDRIIAAR